MKPFLFLIVLVSIITCTSDLSDSIELSTELSWRTLPRYIIPYQYPSGNIESKTSSDLQTWATGYTASTTASNFGTSSTLYNYMPVDTARRCITIFQNTGNALRWVEYEDGNTSWSAPAAISTASSPLLPSVEYIDGLVYEVHQHDGTNPDVVEGSYKSGSTWVTPYFLNYLTMGGQVQIPTDFSPSLEYHATAGVEFLVTGFADRNITGTGIPQIYWRYTNSFYTQTATPSVATGLSNNDLNSSFTPVAVEQNSIDKLFLFYTAPGTSAPGGLTISYIVGSVTGGNDGTVTWSGTSSTISGAYTDHKIDGFFEANTEKIVIAYRNFSTGEIDLAISSNFGSSWTFETGVDDVSGAPSIVNLD